MGSFLGKADTNLGLFLPGFDSDMEINSANVLSWAGKRLTNWTYFLDFLANNNDPQILDQFCPGVASYCAKLHMREGLEWKIKAILTSDGETPDEDRLANWIRLATVTEVGRVDI